MVNDKPYFYLNVGNGQSLLVETATMKISWCMNEEFINQMLEKYNNYFSLRSSDPADARRITLNDLYINITCSHPKESSYFEGYKWEDLSRAVVPLKDMMTYLMVNRPGKFIVHAEIIVARREDAKRWKKDLKMMSARYPSGMLQDQTFENYTTENLSMDTLGLERRDYEYGISYFSYISRTGELPLSQYQLSVDCECPAELFSTMGSNWFTKWVNLPFEQKMIDQCTFRRRLIIWLFATWWMSSLVVGFIYLCYWVLTILWILAGSFMAFIGFGNARWSVLLTNWFDIDKFDDVKRALSDIGDKPNTYKQHPVLLLLHPISWPGYYLVYDQVITGKLWEFLYNWYQSIPFSTIFILTGAVSLVSYLLTTLTYQLIYGDDDNKHWLWGSVPGKIKTAFNTLYDKFDNWLKYREELYLAKLKKDLACGGDPMNLVIPKKPKSVKLVYMAVKSKVCKPMSI